ncbi:MAG: molybdenum cofactor biosynthesis protein MoaE [Alphaproteobacteria bacterium]|nr:molybdenum cofactor biosynthesis protein MoaE [Alphaproteobacteria bacterium]
MIRVQAAPFDPAAELAAFAGRVGGAGGVASFLGLVRGDSDGGEIATLELEHYPPLTERSVAAIGAEAHGRFGLIGYVIVHRTGTLAPGEAIVFVAAAAAHRRAAFEAVDYMMDRLKTEAPFWKREHGPNGSRWIEARAVDHDDRARWA